MISQGSSTIPRQPLSAPSPQTLVEAPKADESPSIADINRQISMDPVRHEQRLAQLFGNALGQVTGVPVRDSEIMIAPIPPFSKFGQWWGLLQAVLASPDFQKWMHDEGVVPESIKITPETGEISYKTKGWGQNRVRTLDDAAWSSVSTPILKVLALLTWKANTPYGPVIFDSPKSASLKAVADFYGESSAIFHGPDPARQRAAELEREPVFARPSNGFSEQELEQELGRQRTLLGNSNTRFAAAEELKKLVSRLYADEPELEILDYLNDYHFTVDPHGSYAARQDAGASKTPSLKQYLHDNGWNIPATREELSNLIQRLLTPSAQSPIHGNNGGALAWPIALDTDVEQQLRSDVRNGKVGGIDLGDSKSVLGYLMQGNYFSPDELKHPQKIIDRLILSPKGRALGEAIQAEMDAKLIKGSAADWLLAVMHMSRSGALDKAASSEDSLEGFALKGSDNRFKPASTVVENLANYLVSEQKASSLEQARVQAYFLLSTHAPEFIVKGIPDKVTPGTHSWVSFTTAVARIEAEAPGATAQMTYEQVMMRADLAPISGYESQVEYVAQQDALQDWAAAQHMSPPVDEESWAAVRNAFNAQILELKAASEGFSAPVPDGKEALLAKLKEFLPDVDEQVLMKKNLVIFPYDPKSPGPYSILDIYAAGRLHDPYGQSPRGKAATRWRSVEGEHQVYKLLDRIKDIPSPSDVLGELYVPYIKRLESSFSSLIKNMTAKLPLKDQQNIEFGEITIVRELDGQVHGVRQEKTTRAKPSVILVKTKNAEGEVNTYEFDYKNGNVSKRSDLGDFKVGRQPQQYNSYFKELQHIETTRKQYPPGFTDAKPVSADLPGSFKSERVSFIADAVLRDVDAYSLLDDARGETTFDTEDPFYRKFEAFLINLIPFGSAIKNFINGNSAQGVIDLSMDVLGFALAFVGGGSLAKGLAAVKGAGKVAQVAKIVGRAALGALNPLGGIGDLVVGGIKSLKNGLKILSSGLGNGERLWLAVKGAATLSDINQKVSLYASFNKLVGEWYGVDPRTGQSFGKPLKDFKPDPVSAALPQNI